MHRAVGRGHVYEQVSRTTNVLATRELRQVCVARFSQYRSQRRLRNVGKTGAQSTQSSQALIARRACSRFNHGKNHSRHSTHPQLATTTLRQVHACVMWRECVPACGSMYAYITAIAVAPCKLTKGCCNAARACYVEIRVCKWWRVCGLCIVYSCAYVLAVVLDIALSAPFVEDDPSNDNPQHAHKAMVLCTQHA